MLAAKMLAWPTASRNVAPCESPSKRRTDKLSIFGINKLDNSSQKTVLPPPETHAVLRVMPMPSDANMHGDVFGGWIMAQVDIAGSIPATRRAEGRVATVAVNAFTFRQPVFVGDLLSFYAEIIKTGTTSITVSVEVYAERKRLEVEVVKVTEAVLTYVATDDNRQRRALPPL
jgi:acyl-CoA thioesterase YciA